MPPKSKSFSGSKKKAQLQKKREKKRDQADSDSDDRHDKNATDTCETRMEGEAAPVVVTSFGGKADSPEARLSSLFMREDDAAVAARRSRGSDPVQDQTQRRRQAVAKFVDYALPAGARDQRPDLLSGARGLPHPVRPDWSQGISGAELERREDAYFKVWCEETYKRIKSLDLEGGDVAPFELNLEVWRQLWRVVEQSDVIVLVVDVRNPTFHMPPSLVQEVTVTHGLRLVIALNKVDLVHQAFVQRWKQYLSKVVPEVGLVEFSSRLADDPPGGERGAGGVAARRKWIHRRTRQGDLDLHLDNMGRSLMTAVLGKEGGTEIRSQKTSANGSARVESKTTAREDEVSTSDAEDDTDTEAGEDAGVTTAANAESGVEVLAEADAEATTVAEVNPEAARDACVDVEATAEAEEHALSSGKGPGGALAIGLIGHPNVGKTSVLNALAGRKAASVSGTAGHTKHLQHIRVQETLHPNAYVIDCPGLVFPSPSVRAEAELNGLLPLAQVRETTSAVRILAENLPLPSLLGLKLPDWYDNSDPWSPLAICEAYAEKHRFVFPRSGRPDVHRAGLEIMKDCTDGAILLSYEPPPIEAWRQSEAA